jgi:hypothetical protein
MRKRYLLIAGVLLPLIACILFHASHPTDYHYNDWWVIGRHMEEIEERYGAPDLGAYRNGSTGRVGYYIYTDHGSLFRIDPDHLRHYYYIEYDESGTATRVYDSGQPGG